MSELLIEVLKASVAGVIGALISGIVIFFSNRKGNRIIVTRISETDQIKVSPSGYSNLEILYKGEPIKGNLVLNTLHIANRGNKIVDNLIICINIFPNIGQIDFLEINASDPLEKTLISQENNNCIISRDFLNPLKKYKDEQIILHIISNIPLDFSIKGGGKDWYAVYKNIISKPTFGFIVTSKEFIPTAILSFLLIGLLAIIVVVGYKEDPHIVIQPKFLAIAVATLVCLATLGLNYLFLSIRYVFMLFSNLDTSHLQMKIRKFLYE